LDKIPFAEIDHAIRINSAINDSAPKTLSFKKWQGMNNSGLGLCIFIYIALKVGYTSEEICDYLGMAPGEYKSKERILTDLHDTGRLLFEERGHEASYIETKEAYITFYRKLLLAQNYLRYRFDYNP